MGLLGAASSTGRLVFLPLLAMVVTALGWQAVGWVVAGCLLLLAVPLVAVLMRDAPAALGLTPYGTAAAAGEPLAVFGALSFWWMGEHGTPRIDTSEHVWFANDQLAVRFIEEIDFDYAAVDATAALLAAEA